MAKRTHINLGLKQRITAAPCLICGIPFDIHCDHVIPVAKGGTSDVGNLQPLCRDCNYTKKHLLNNAQVAEIVKEKGLAHFLFATYRWDTRFDNPYDGPDFVTWRNANPERARFAERLHKVFEETFG